MPSLEVDLLHLLRRGLAGQLSIVREAVNSLDAAIVGDNLLLDLIRPSSEVPGQVLVDNLELPTEDPLGVDVTGVSLHHGLT